MCLAESSGRESHVSSRCLDCVQDWYHTLAGLAGVDATDHAAASAGLPPIDSLDMWPLVSGAVKTSPREDILVNENLLVSGDWKYVRPNTNMIEASWGWLAYPNHT